MMTTTPAQWFHTRPNTPPDVRTHHREDGDWEILLCIEGGITSERDALRAAALTRKDITTLTDAAHHPDEYAS